MNSGTGDGSEGRDVAGWPDALGPLPAGDRLSDLWRLGPSEVVCFVGGGGKTTLLERLAGEYEAEGELVVLTTTTRVLAPGEGGRPLVTAPSIDSLLAGLADPPSRSPLVGVEVQPDGKLRGVPPEWVRALRGLPWASAVLVEADGAAGHPLKAPAPWEPALPGCTSLLVALAGLDAQGAPLDRAHAHRPEILAELLHVPLGSTLTPASLLEALLRGYLPHRPAGAKFLAYLNKADRHPAHSDLLAAAAAGRAEVWSGSALEGGFRRLAPVEARPAALVLAAGLATRMGGEKLLAPLGAGSVLGRVVAAVAHHPGLAEVVVVAGAEYVRVESALRAELPAGGFRVVANPRPGEGQGSSLRRGVEALSEVRDLLVLLGDQPFVSAQTVDRLLSAWPRHPRAAAVGLTPGAPAPSGGESAGAGRAGGAPARPPVILHRSLLPQLLELEGDQGAREVLRRQARSVVGLAAIGDELLDVDEPADLERARRLLTRRGRT